MLTDWMTLSSLAWEVMLTRVSTKEMVILAAANHLRLKILGKSRTPLVAIRRLRSDWEILIGMAVLITVFLARLVI